MPFMVVQSKIELFYVLRELTGLVFLTGLIVYIASYFVGSKDPEATIEGEVVAS